MTDFNTDKKELYDDCSQAASPHAPDSAQVSRSENGEAAIAVAAVADKSLEQGEWCLGIDLGTTNCAMAGVAVLDGGSDDVDDNGQSTVGPQIVPIPQVVAPGVVESRNLLPSYLYIPGPHELPPGALDLPWDHEAQSQSQEQEQARGGQQWGVGEFARNQGSRIPHRMVFSAKSWLCNPFIDRTAPVLPINSPPEVEHISPMEASARYLTHLRRAWESRQQDSALADNGAGTSYNSASQEVVLTVPASFNEVARNLTVEAARKAGFGRPVLLEEPQAALYAWLNSQGENWREYLSEGDLVLVCDVGGGTTDFSLIGVASEDGNLVFRRMAVGDHILLGGDNMDLALAWNVRTKLQQARNLELDSRQFAVLVQACRAAKEALLNQDGLEVATVAIPGRGSKLMGGAITTELTRQEVDSIILDGFLPPCDPWDKPEGADGFASHDAGLSEMGLPYAADPAVTRHLAYFLNRHSGIANSGDADRGTEQPKKKPAFPTAILFNGGVFKSPKLQERILTTINEWLDLEGCKPLKVLRNSQYDSAVAVGAAYYGAVRRGKGIRIRGGTARSYYVGVTQSMPAVPGFKPPVLAVCLAPSGMEEGSSVALKERDFGLAVGAPTRFRFFSSTVRKTDMPGTVVQDWAPDELEELPVLETVLHLDADAEDLGDTGYLEAGVGASAREVASASVREVAGAGVGGSDRGATTSTVNRPPLVAGSRIPVNLKAEVTAVGTMILSCVEKANPSADDPSMQVALPLPASPASREWKLEFNLRQKASPK